MRVGPTCKDQSNSYQVNVYIVAPLIDSLIAEIDPTVSLAFRVSGRYVKL